MVVENYIKAVGFAMLGKSLIKTSPPSLGKFAIITMSDFTKDYLTKQKIIPDSTVKAHSVI